MFKLLRTPNSYYTFRYYVVELYNWIFFTTITKNLLDFPFITLTRDLVRLVLKCYELLYISIKWFDYGKIMWRYWVRKSLKFWDYFWKVGGINIVQAVPWGIFAMILYLKWDLTFKVSESRKSVFQGRLNNTKSK